MRLPNGDKAVIDPRKLTEYSLSFEHDDGKHKALLFRDLVGIVVENCDLLIQALREAAANGEAIPGRLDRYGQRYTIDFDFTGPADTARIRSAWIVPSGQDVPRLVTCYIL